MLKQTRTIAHVKEIFVAPNAVFCVGRTDVKNSTKIINLNLSYLGLKLSLNFPAVQSWTSANAGLKFNPLFLVCIFLLVRLFRNARKLLSIQTKISEEIFPNFPKQVVGFEF